MSFSSDLVHVMEFFPWLFACIVVLLGLKTCDPLDKPALIIVLAAAMFITVQSLWWIEHFYFGVHSPSVGFHMVWAMYDTFIMLIFIYLLRGRK